MTLCDDSGVFFPEDYADLIASVKEACDLPVYVEPSDALNLAAACAKIGAVAVTVNTNYKQSELEYLCKDSDMHTLCIVNGDRGSNDFVNIYKSNACSCKVKVFNDSRKGSGFSTDNCDS